MLPPILTTEDGSITCLEPSSGELYHNRAGAYSEALRNYVLPCALPSLLSKQRNLKVLDVCFGLGYNSFVLLEQLFLLVQYEERSTKKFCLDLLGLDKDLEILELIPTVLSDARFEHLVRRLPKATERQSKLIEDWRQPGCHVFSLGSDEELDVRFELRCADIREELPKLALACKQSFDFIFHDGFSPQRVPELWTVDLFGHYLKLLASTGKIITYSSATAVRGALQELGLRVMKTAALGGKSGGTIAGWQIEASQTSQIYPLTPSEEERLKSRSSIPYRDPGLSDSRNEILRRRQQEIACSKQPVLARKKRE